MFFPKNLAMPFLAIQELSHPSPCKPMQAHASPCLQQHRLNPFSRQFVVRQRCPGEVSLELRLKDLEVNGHADLCARKHRVVVSLMLGLVKGGLQVR